MRQLITTTLKQLKKLKEEEEEEEEGGGWSHPMASKEVALEVGRNHPQAKWGWLPNFFFYFCLFRVAEPKTTFKIYL
jgi:hypothetical protein